MDLKETTHLPKLKEMNIVDPSEKNHSNNQKIYNVIFSSEDEFTDTTTDTKYSDNKKEERIFGNVSTLDWLKTWRSIEIS